MVPHVHVHRRRDDDRGGAGQIERSQKIVGDTPREFGEDVGGGWRDEQQVRSLRHGDVFDGAFQIGFAAGLGEEIGDDFLAAQSGERKRGDEFAGAASHHDLDGEGVLLEAADEFRGFVSRHSAGYA
jgi:hypothetical protein